jgi:hypothetical protein
MACSKETPRDSATTIQRWVVTPDSAGPVRVGMQADSALVALGSLPARAARSSCDYLKVDAPVEFMVENDTVVRFDVRDTIAATSEGARVGDSLTRILQLYAGRLRTQPHKYTNGKYLIVTPGPDTTRQLIFETDTARVVSYRAGRLPAVGYVERCG